MEQKINFEFNGKPSHVNIRYFGDAQPGNILALHGLGTQGYCFDNLAPKLQSKLIAIDWYGYGKSDRRLGSNDKYDPQTCADWLLAAVQALQSNGILINNFSVLAISMSAIPLALNYKKLSVKKIIFIHPAGLDKKINKKMAFGLTSGLLSDGILKFITWHPVWELIWFFTPIKSSEERRNYIKNDVKCHLGEFEVLRRYAKSGFDFLGNMKNTHVIPEYFAKITCPVLLLYGKDTTFYQKNYLNFGKKMNWKILHITKAPHNMIRSHAYLIAEPINNFLAKG